MKATRILALVSVVLVVSAPMSRAGDDCPGSPCASCATVEPTFQPAAGDIAVHYDPGATSPARALLVAEAASGASIMSFPPWQLGPACTLPAHCTPRYNIVIKPIDSAGRVPVGEPHLILLDTDFVETASALQVTAAVFHEWVHWAQLCYYDIDEYEAWGEWVIEGTAASFEDKIETLVDRDPDSSYVKDWANPALGLPGEPLYYQDYRAALWWTYLSEQLGLEFDEPALGVNVIRHFIEYALPKNPPDNMKYLRNTVAHFDPSRTLESIFRDFCIANYTKQHDLGDLPEELRDRYRYVDESPEGGGTVLQNVSVFRDDFGLGVEQDFEVSSWSATYLEQRLEDISPCSAVGMRGEAEEGKELYWVLIGIRSERDGRERVSKLSWRRGRFFNRSFLSLREDSFTRLAVVAIGLDGGPIEAKLTIDAGTAQPRVIAPSGNAPICIPNGARFGVEVQVDGPAGLTPPGADPAKASVGGLVKTDFGVALVSAATNAAFPANVGFSYQLASGSYGLTCRAPEIDTATHGDMYHLRVCLCPDAEGDCGGASDLESQAIVLGDFVTHQVLALDVSGSMAYDNKLEAARTMARFLVNSAPTSSSLGLVIFSGNGSEMSLTQGACDNDARLVRSLAPMTSLNQLQLAEAVDSDVVTANGYTSIGDGLLAALTDLNAQAEPADKKRIMLLTDGMENEAAYWRGFYNRCGTDPVRLSFDPEEPGAPGAGVRIDARGFGPDANVEFLDELTGLTGGVAESVPTDEPTLGNGAGAGGAGVTLHPDALDLTVANRLAESFRSVHEDALGLERLYFASAIATGAPTDFRIPVSESLGGGVRRAAFGFNWSGPGDVTVVLRDGSGAVVTGQTPGWRIVRPPAGSPRTNVVYHHAGLLATGEYTATVTASSPEQVICLLSGALARGVETTLRVTSPAPDAGFCVHNAGVPVRLTLTVADGNGGIAELDPVAVVRNPDGSYNRRTLFDDGEHFDGEADDGIYANTYPRTPFIQPVIGDRREHDEPLINENFGTYSVRVTAQGENSFDEGFARYESSLFTVTERLSVKCPLDDDRDGLLDPWEEQVGLDPGDATDAAIDFDNDSLSNADEFLHGTDPFNPDSDFGGESDGSEVAAGRDPIWERDDALPPIQDFGFVRGATDVRDETPPPPGFIRLRFPASTEYQSMHIYRTTTPNPTWTDFVEIAAVDVHERPRGLYRDVEVSPHVKHHYYLQAEGLSGALTPPTPIISWITSPVELANPGGSLDLGITAELVEDDGRLWRIDADYLAVEASSTRLERSRGRIDTSLLEDADIPLDVLGIGRSGELHYTIPVANGPFRATLYFAEICPPCVSPALGGRGCEDCTREFEVTVERERRIANPADAALPPAGDGKGRLFAATQLVVDADVTDGVLDVRLRSTRDSRHPPLLLALSITNISEPRPSRERFIIRGDCNDDGELDISDAVCSLRWLFLGGAAPICRAAPDANGDSEVDISDATYVLNHLFLGGRPPVRPYPGCGRLPDSEAERCEEQPSACR